MKKKSFLFLASAALTAGLLSGCGGGDAAAPAAATATTTTAGATTPGAAAPATTTPAATPPAAATSAVPANASSGILGETLATVFAGDYNLSCFGSVDFLGKGPITKFAFKVNTNGTSTLNGIPWIDTSNPGYISTTPSGLSFVREQGFVTNGGPGLNTASINFLPDGQLNVIGVITNGKEFNCSPPKTISTGQAMVVVKVGDGQTLDQTVPATLVKPSNQTFFNSIGKKLARTEVVTGCTTGGTPTLALGADGSINVGAVSYSGMNIISVIDHTFDNTYKTQTVDGKRYSQVGWSGGSGGTTSYDFDENYKTKQLISVVSFAALAASNFNVSCIK